MQALSILVGLALGAVALAFVLQPLYRRDAGKKGGAQLKGAKDEGELLPLIGREQAARAAIHEVELDYQLGNIAEADYRVLRERYMRRAIVALKDRYEAGESEESEKELDEAIEAQVRKLREGDENVGD